MRKERELVARCRICNRNNIPLSEMAIMSWKELLGEYSGSCSVCMNDPDAEQRYIQGAKVTLAAKATLTPPNSRVLE